MLFCEYYTGITKELIKKVTEFEKVMRDDTRRMSKMKFLRIKLEYFYIP